MMWICSNFIYVSGAKNVITLESGWEARIAEENEAYPEPALPDVKLDNLAYTVYSSGTTGKPKGI